MIDDTWNRYAFYLMGLCCAWYITFEVAFNPYLTQQSCIVYIQSLLCHLFCLLAGDVIGIRSVPCGRIEWEPATVAGCSDDGITYRIRVFTGSSFSSTGDDDRDILSSNTNSLSLTLNQLPRGRPLKAMVKARRSNGVFSANWSEAMNIIEESDNC
jgi:hypothetical protein